MVYTLYDKNPSLSLQNILIKIKRKSNLILPIIQDLFSKIRVQGIVEKPLTLDISRYVTEFNYIAFLYCIVDNSKITVCNIYLLS